MVAMATVAMTLFAWNDVKTCAAASSLPAGA